MVRQGEGAAWTLRVGARELPIGEADEELDLWPWLVRSGDGSAFVGVRRSRSTTYSGGGASATMLTLVEVGTGAVPLRPVLDVPVAGSAMIRACFSPHDRRRRRGICHDQYQFTGWLRPVAADTGMRPALVLETNAHTSPGRRSRAEDDDRLIRTGQTGRWRDPLCSYRRTFTFDPIVGRYEPDRPLPPCPDYLDP